MKYDHLVKHNGIMYKAGEEVPVGNSSTQSVNSPDMENTEGGENTDTAGDSEYKKSDIQRMAVDDLKALATKLEIEDAQNKTGAVLKEEIIAKLGL